MSAFLFIPTLPTNILCHCDLASKSYRRNDDGTQTMPHLFGPKQPFIFDTKAT